MFLDDVSKGFSSFSHLPPAGVLLLTGSSPSHSVRTKGSLSHRRELPRSHELLVMHLLQHWHVLHRALPHLRWFIGILRIFNLHSIDVADRIILVNLSMS